MRSVKSSVTLKELVACICPREPYKADSIILRGNANPIPPLGPTTGLRVILVVALSLLEKCPQPEVASNTRLGGHPGTKNGNEIIKTNGGQRREQM